VGFGFYNWTILFFLIQRYAALLRVLEKKVLVASKWSTMEIGEEEILSSTLHS